MYSFFFFDIVFQFIFIVKNYLFMEEMLIDNGVVYSFNFDLRLIFNLMELSGAWKSFYYFLNNLIRSRFMDMLIMEFYL